MNQSCPQPADNASQKDAPLEGEISSEQLLGGKAEVLIRHGEDLYRLRLTRNGKLILQK
jgi:hemin uptake protein HemP